MTTICLANTDKHASVEKNLPFPIFLYTVFCFPVQQRFGYIRQPTFKTPNYEIPVFETMQTLRKLWKDAHKRYLAGRHARGGVLVRKKRQSSKSKGLKSYDSTHMFYIYIKTIVLFAWRNYTKIIVRSIGYRSRSKECLYYSKDEPFMYQQGKSIKGYKRS